MQNYMKAHFELEKYVTELENRVVTLEVMISKALDKAYAYGGREGHHYKAYLIDQMVRELTDCRQENVEALDYKQQPYTYKKLGESEDYLKFIYDFQNADGPDTILWDIGIAP